MVLAGSWSFNRALRENLWNFDIGVTRGILEGNEKEVECPMVFERVLRSINIERWNVRGEVNQSNDEWKEEQGRHF